MDRNRLKALAKEGRFISGIYNYCDRWCERCPMTARCLNYALSEESASDPESRDIRNEAFWKHLQEMFEDTQALLREAAKGWGIDLDAMEIEEGFEQREAERETLKDHLLFRVAQQYAIMVEDWFKERESLFFEEAAAAREGIPLDEAIEVIRWYQYFISAKVMRAVQGMMNELEEDLDFPRDSDGSAKIALIAIDRSIAAWALIRQYLTEGMEEVGSMVILLDNLRQAIEKTFPRARSFLRPGFDTGELKE